MVASTPARDLPLLLAGPLVGLLTGLVCGDEGWVRNEAGGAGELSAVPHRSQ
jgi:hypothetical protein